MSFTFAMRIYTCVLDESLHVATEAKSHDLLLPYHTCLHTRMSRQALVQLPSVSIAKATMRHFEEDEEAKIGSKRVYINYSRSRSIEPRDGEGGGGGGGGGGSNNGHGLGMNGLIDLGRIGGGGSVGGSSGGTPRGGGIPAGLIGLDGNGNGAGAASQVIIYIYISFLFCIWFVVLSCGAENTSDVRVFSMSPSFGLFAWRVVLSFIVDINRYHVIDALMVFMFSCAGPRETEVSRLALTLQVTSERLSPYLAASYRPCGDNDFARQCPGMMCIACSAVGIKSSYTGEVFLVIRKL